MRKQYKIKERSCGLCKPYKKGWDNRWKAKDRAVMHGTEKEIKEHYNNPFQLLRDK